MLLNDRQPVKGNDLIEQGGDLMSSSWHKVVRPGFATIILIIAIGLIMVGCGEGDESTLRSMSSSSETGQELQTSTPTDEEPPLRFVEVTSKPGERRWNQPMLEITATVENTGQTPVTLFIYSSSGRKYGEYDIRWRKQDDPNFKAPYGLGIEQSFSEEDDFHPAAAAWFPKGQQYDPTRPPIQDVIIAPGETRAFQTRVLSPQATMGAKYYRAFLIDPELVRFDEMEPDL
jgi:hypothetical protein